MLEDSCGAELMVWGTEEGMERCRGELVTVGRGFFTLLVITLSPDLWSPELSDEEEEAGVRSDSRP